MSGRHVSSSRDPVGKRLVALVAILLAAALVLTLLALFRGDEVPVAAPGTTTTIADPTDTTGTSGAGASTTGTSTTGTSSASTSTTGTSTTGTSTTETTGSTTTLANPLSALALSPTGIGDVAFGTDADEAVAQIALVLGTPTEDTGWTDSFDTCPGTESRVVRWTSLQVFLTNGATDWAPEGTRHFFHFGQSILAGGGELIDLTTTTGIGINSTLGELAADYGDEVTIVDDPVFGPFWELDVPGAGVLWGTAGAMGDNGMIDSINGASGCGE